MCELSKMLRSFHAPRAVAAASAVKPTRSDKAPNKAPSLKNNGKKRHAAATPQMRAAELDARRSVRLFVLQKPLQ